MVNFRRGTLFLSGLPQQKYVKFILKSIGNQINKIKELETQFTENA